MLQIRNSKILLILACLSALLLIGPLVFYFTDSLILSGMGFLGTLLIVFTIIRFVLIEPQQSVHITAVSIFGCAVLAATSVSITHHPLVWSLITWALINIDPSFSDFLQQPNPWHSAGLSIVIIIAAVVVIFLIIRSNTNRVNRLHGPKYLSDDIYKQISAALTDHINSLDRDLRFFNFKNEPIHPKLEEVSSVSRYVHIQSPLSAISNSENGSLIIVKGEPGSGKSVMLRDVTKKLLDQASTVNKLPLYLNLAECEIPNDFTIDQISNAIHLWVRSEFSKRLSPALRLEAENIFDQAYKTGNLIFLFDAFDENLTVASDKHSGAIITKISESLAQYIHGSGGCIGLVFSRDYKSPNVGWLKHRTFNVRPFTRTQVRKYAYENCKYPENFIYEIEHERPDLFAMSSRPLLLALLVDYSNRNNGLFPDAEYDIYDNFVRSRIEHALEILGLKAGVADQAYSLAQKLSDDTLSLYQQQSIINDNSDSYRVLVEAGLIKKSQNKVKFLHRRLQEYFKVVGILEGNEKLPDLSKNYIARNRDLIKLYVEVCSDDEAKDFAERVYSRAVAALNIYFNSENISDYSPVIMYLRLLRDIGRNRPELIETKQDSLGILVRQLWNTEDLIHQKHSLEFLSLVPPNTAAQLFQLALESGSGWLRRISLNEGRYVWRLQSWLGRRVTAFLADCNEQDVLMFNKFYDIKAVTLNADTIDRYGLAGNVFIRISLIVACLMGYFVQDHLIGKMFAILFIFYVLVDDGEIFSTSSNFSWLNNLGFDRGFTGLFSINMITLFLSETTQLIINSESKVFYQEGTYIQNGVSFINIFLFVTLILNRHLIKVRDDADTLESLELKSVKMFRIEAMTELKIIEIFRKYSALILLVLLLVIIQHLSDPYQTWLLIGVLVFFFISVILVPFKRLAQTINIKILEKRDQLVVSRFRKHFSGFRYEIADAFDEVGTKNAKMDILSHAESVSNEKSELLSRSDNLWPDGIRPELGDVLLNSYLAMLDEAWLGLN